MTEQAARRPNRLLVIGAVIFVALLVLGAVTQLVQGDGRGGRQRSADSYANEYGGSGQVYADILRETDCVALQETFDRAAANNDTADDAAERRWTTGYMTAANARMQRIGC